jgi:anthranilate synthase
MIHDTYRTKHEILIDRRRATIPYAGAVEPLIDALERRRGVLLSSGVEAPGRYTRWDIGFHDPPIAITARDRAFAIEALNARGGCLLGPIEAAVRQLDAVTDVARRGDTLSGAVHPADAPFAEELRSRQPSVFSVLRAIVALFASERDRHLGLYGAFGYDLAFQFDPIRRRLPRPSDQRDMVLYVPDELTVVDHARGEAFVVRYDFTTANGRTHGLPRETAASAYTIAPPAEARDDHAPGEYGALVDHARAAFHRGDLFEAVVSQTFRRAFTASPAALFRRLRDDNPAPYGALLNLGDGELLVSASPEMFVRVSGLRVETCPISGTVPRGRDAIEDAAQVLALLSSQKDAAELTMCTDVDRNDKSRVCEPGSVRVIARRHLEHYSRLIHTLDHVEGTLREGFDALDAFLSHTWAVTVTGAPKRWAMQFLEDHEKTARRWYGGAIGHIGFDGGMNTGLTLRTFRLKDGVAEVRAGATLLWGSEPEKEDAECRLKASALFAALDEPPPRPSIAPAAERAIARRVLLVDHEDSFVHTLANYFRQKGAAVTTLRSEAARRSLARGDAFDLVVLSPGPGRPATFDVSATIDEALRRDLPLFGVCLGLQGIVEHFGGELGTSEEPVHGKPSIIRTCGGALFDGLPERFGVGRYHSLFALENRLPSALRVTARTEGDGVVMAIEHASLPIAAVQFHPESILTGEGGIGLAIIEAVMTRLARPEGSPRRAAPSGAGS